MIYQWFSRWSAAAVLVSLILSAAISSVSGQDPKTPSQGESRPGQAGERSQQSTLTLRHTDRNEESEEQPDDIVSTETDLANVFFTAADKNRRFITTLRKEDIRLVEDGLAQEIFTFQRETDRPLSLAILVDVSVSQQLTLPEEKDAARRFVNAVVHHAKDEVAVISFSGEATVEQGLTNRISSVQQALERIEIVLPPGYIGNGMIVQSPTPRSTGADDPRIGTTAIWDAVWVVSESYSPISVKKNGVPSYSFRMGSTQPVVSRATKR